MRALKDFRFFTLHWKRFAAWGGYFLGRSGVRVFTIWDGDGWKEFYWQLKSYNQTGSEENIMNTQSSSYFYYWLYGDLQLPSEAVRTSNDACYHVESVHANLTSSETLCRYFTDIYILLCRVSIVEFIKIAWSQRKTFKECLKSFQKILSSHLKSIPLMERVASLVFTSWFRFI